MGLSPRSTVGKIDLHRPLSIRAERVLILVSASRSGSSLVASWLANADGLFGLSGEVNSLLHRAGVTAVHAGDQSDALTAADVENATTGMLESCFWDELGARPKPGTPLHLELFVPALRSALSSQWPGVRFVAADVNAWADEIVARRNWRLVGDFIPEVFMLDFIRLARPHYPILCPYRYDIPDAVVRSAFPELVPPTGPLATPSLEDTPFVLPTPRLKVAPPTAAGGWIVIKSPSNSYRLPFLRALFPFAELRVLHLVRNPAASINGLIDGWLHRNFYSRTVDLPLAIGGLPSDLSQRHWWKFDLPPGWQRLRSAPVERVCATQWLEANRAGCAGIADCGLRNLRIRFEDFVDPDSGPATRQHVLRWLGLSDVPDIWQPDAPVMATQPPKAFRWKQRERLIRGVIADPAILSMAEALGYGRQPDCWS